MIQKTRQKFREFPSNVRSMVFIFWIYKFVLTMTSIFLNVFVYLKTESVTALAWYLLIGNTTLMIGFVVGGLLISHFGLSTERNFLWSFLLFFLASVLLVVLPHTFGYLLLFGAIMSLGNGIFWLNIHLLELSQLQNAARDFYSSMNELGGQLITVLAPLLATVTFVLSERVLHMGTYTLLFFVLPLIYLSAIPLVRQAPSFVPPKTSWHEVASLFRTSTIATQQYYAAGSSLYAIQSVVIPVVGILALRTVINLGLVQTMLGLLSLLVITILAHRRHEGNRLQLLGITSCLNIVTFVVLYFFDQSVFAFLLYSAMAVALKPIQRVSEHVIDLDSVERLKGTSSFIAPLLYRDFSLWIFRALTAVVIIVLGSLGIAELTLLHIGILLMIVLMFLNWKTARRLIQQNSEIL